MQSLNVVNNQGLNSYFLGATRCFVYTDEKKGGAIEARAPSFEDNRPSNQGEKSR